MSQEDILDNSESEPAFPDVVEAVQAAWQSVVAQGVDGFTKKDIAAGVLEALKADSGFEWIRNSHNLGEATVEEILNIMKDF